MDQITQKLYSIPDELKTLLESSKLFDAVFVGQLENIFTLNLMTATIYVKGGDTEETMGGYNLPQSLELVVGIVARGAKPETHSSVYSATLTLLDHFRNDESWTTLNGKARHVLVERFDIFPYNTGRNYITQGVLRLKCDVRMRIR